METELAKLTIADRKSMKPAVTFVSKDKGLTGAYPLAVKPGAKVYRYDVEIVKHNSADTSKNKIVTKNAADDGEKSLRRMFCMEVVSSFHAATNNFGLGDAGKLYIYDGAKQLYLVAPMKLDAGKKRKEFARGELSTLCQNQLAGSLTVTIEISQSQQHEINISDVQSMLASRENTGDRSIAQFLDLLTSQAAVASTNYVSLGLGKLFQRRGELMDRNAVIELRCGLNKGIQPIEKDGKPYLALVVDAKKTAFYTAGTLPEILHKSNALGNRNALRAYSSLYNGVRATLTYAQNRTILIESITDELVKNARVNGDSMIDFFKKKYNIKVDPNLPVIKTDRAHFPMDTLLICPNQRVPMEKLDENVRRTILMGTAVLPVERFKRIREECINAKITAPGNPYFEAFNVKVIPNLMEIPINVRAAPGIHASLGGKPVVLHVDNGAFKLGGLFQSTQMFVIAESYVVLYPSRTQAPKGFVEQLIRTAAKLNLKLGTPSYEEIDFTSYDTMAQKFKELNGRKTRFALVFDFQRNKSHHNLKLLEREHSVLTMQIKIETTQRQGLGQTLENLVLKINAKAMGVNVIPSIEKCGEMLSLQQKDIKVFVVGLDVSLPSRGNPKELFDLRQKGLGHISSCEPAIVGVTGNYGKQASTILGDYYYQPASHEVLDSDLLKANFSKLVERFSKARSGFPDVIVVFRDGVGEGQLHKTTQAEYPIFEQVCREMKGAVPNIIYIIVTKKHNKRFALGVAGKEVNCKPGSSINSGITRPDIPEFYLQSHRPIKGTAKSAHYSIMMNPKNVPEDAIQAFCNHLCYNHQVVNSAVSLPEPIYHAKEMTKRGRNNLGAKRSANKGNVPRLANGLIDYDKVSATLSYAPTPLGNIKFAA